VFPSAKRIHDEEAVWIAQCFEHIGAPAEIRGDLANPDFTGNFHTLKIFQFSKYNKQKTAESPGTRRSGHGDCDVLRFIVTDGWLGGVCRLWAYARNERGQPFWDEVAD
jgi:hypothetical protein